DQRERRDRLRRRGRGSGFEAREGEEARHRDAGRGRLSHAGGRLMAVAHLVIRGRVQGVWYRGSMQREARRLGILGWVRNRHDGSVEAEIAGQRDVLDVLIAWAHRGPGGARGRDVAGTWRGP